MTELDLVLKSLDTIISLEQRYKCGNKDELFGRYSRIILKNDDFIDALSKVKKSQYVNVDKI